MSAPAASVDPPRGLLGLAPPFWVVFAGSVVNRLGGFVFPLLPLYLTRERGLSPAWAAGVVSLYGAGTLAGSLLGGILADRWGRRPTILLALLGGGPAMVALGLARSLPAICAATLATAVVTEAYRPAVQAFVADVVPARDRVRAYGYLHWAVNAGFAVAPVVGGLLARRSYLTMFLVDAATTCAFGLIVLLGLREPRREAAPAGVQGARDGGGLGPVLSDRLFLVLCGAGLLFATMFLQAFTNLSVTMGRRGYREDQFGMVIATNGLLIVLAQPFAARLARRLPPPLALGLAALFAGVGLGLLAPARGLGLLVGGVLVFTVGEMLWNPVSNAAVAELAPAHLRGRYQGVFIMTWGLAATIGPVAGGLVLERAGEQALWLGCLGAGVALSALMVPVGRALARRSAAGTDRGREVAAPPTG